MQTGRNANALQGFLLLEPFADPVQDRHRFLGPFDPQGTFLCQLDVLDIMFLFGGCLFLSWHRYSPSEIYSDKRFITKTRKKESTKRRRVKSFSYSCFRDMMFFFSRIGCMQARSFQDKEHAG
jgi:hypothetical protein